MARHDDREYFAVEVISNHVNGSDADAEADFRSHVAANGLFRGDLRLEGSQFLENAYPIYRGRADLKAVKATEALKGVRSRVRSAARAASTISRPHEFRHWKPKPPCGMGNKIGDESNQLFPSSCLISIWQGRTRGRHLRRAGIAGERHHGILLVTLPRSSNSFTWASSMRFPWASSTQPSASGSLFVFFNFQSAFRVITNDCVLGAAQVLGFNEQVHHHLPRPSDANSIQVP